MQSYRDVGIKEGDVLWTCSANGKNITKVTKNEME